MVLKSRNSGNRPLSRSHVEHLTKEMVNGNWKINGDTICLNCEKLIDGQHRLAAVVASGVTIKSFVIEGLPSEIFDTKDIGKRRSAGDTLGVRGEKNACRLAATLVMIDKYMTGRADMSVKYTNSEIEGLLEKYPDVRTSIHSNHSSGIIAPSVLDACHYLFSKKDVALADEFVEKITRGAGLVEGSPWYVLRERLLRNNLSKAKFKKPYIMAICIKAWNFTRAGKPVRVLTYREEGAHGEAYPIVQ